MAIFFGGSPKPRSMRFPQAHGAIRDAVDLRLNEFLDEIESPWPIPSVIDELLGPARQLLRGGKRMRAVLGAIGYAIGCDIRSTDPSIEPDQPYAQSPAIRLGAALELYQASALVHDDILDAAPTRRGMPAAHIAYSAMHTERAWRGSAQQFGTNGAILLGDFLLSLSAREMGNAVAATTLTSTQAAHARNAFDEMTAEVAFGQYLDVRSQALTLGTAGMDKGLVDDALTVVRYKSARYSVQRPLLLGALLAGVGTDSPALDALASIGEEIGIAFQLRDDDLGVFGDSALTGKPAGADLREGKRTALVALAWERSDEAGHALLDEVLAHEGASDALIDRAAQHIVDCGARGAHEELIAVHCNHALAHLEASLADEVLAPSHVHVLREVMVHLTERSH